MISALDQKAISHSFLALQDREILESSTLPSVVNLQFTMEFKTPFPHSRRHKRIMRPPKNISWNVAHEEALSRTDRFCLGHLGATDMTTRKWHASKTLGRGLHSPHLISFYCKQKNLDAAIEIFIAAKNYSEL